MPELRLKVLDRDLYTAETQESRFGAQRLGDAGLDLRARFDITVNPGPPVRIPLGVSFEFPGEYVGWLTGRSSLSLSYGLITHEGKIDSGYRGEVHAIVQAMTVPVQITRGERIAQIVIVKIEPPKWTIVEELSETDRGKLGLGSTGRV